MKYKYLFGPVPSRRLGVSLGIDIIPYKTCTLNCVYCECGRTTRLTATRKEYAPVKEVIYELREYLQKEPELDYVTFSGSGEPTLHSKIDIIIHFIKEYFPRYNVAVLTNGTLFTEEEVRVALRRADLVIPSLDAAAEDVFKKLNRPHGSLSCEKVISGLAQFRKEYPGEIRLEVFIVPGLNDGEEHIAMLRKAVQKINPDRIQLNTLDRPGAEPWVRTARDEEIQQFAKYLGDNVEIIGKFKPRNGITSFSGKEQSILLTLKRRPCTAEDLSYILRLPLLEVNKYLQMLLEKGQIVGEQQKRGKFYKIINR